jgi:hypothetical protein
MLIRGHNDAFKMQALRSIATGDIFVGGFSRKLRVSDFAHEGGILFDNPGVVGVIRVRPGTSVIALRFLYVEGAVYSQSLGG